jgi:hypothetical protein
MRKKPSYEELQQKVKNLEKQVIEVRQDREALRDSEKNYRLPARCLRNIFP